MKKFLLSAFILVVVFTLNACNSSNNTTVESNIPEETTEVATEEATAVEDDVEPITITVGIPPAPPSLPILRMMETNALGDNVTIKMDIWNEPETLIAMVQDGQHDMFAFPLTVVSKLYNKGVGIQLMNVNTWGVTYFMTSDDNFKEWSDLKGKTVYIPLQSSPPDALTQYFISNAGLTIGEDVEVIYASMQEVANLLASGEAVYATLIEPQVTRAKMLNEKVRVAMSFEEEWQKINHTKTMIPNAGFGATTRFIKDNPELASAFEKAYAEAVKWANENPAEMGALAEKHFGLKKELIAKSLPNMGLTYKRAVDAKEELDMFYDLLFDFEPKMIGGKKADDNMYYGN